MGEIVRQTIFLSLNVRFILGGPNIGGIGGTTPIKSEHDIYFLPLGPTKLFSRKMYSKNHVQ
jgi:hypothetical protein